MGASALVAVALLAAGRLINAWLFGLLLLVAWALLTYGLRAFVLKRSRQLVVSLTALVLVFVVWNYTAKQPRIAVEGVQLRKLPSTVQPGLVEIVVRNDGGVAADISVLPVGELAPLYRNARDLVAANVEGDLRGLMKKARATTANRHHTCRGRGKDRHQRRGAVLRARLVFPAWRADAAGDRARPLPRSSLPAREGVLPVHDSAVGVVDVVPLSE